MAGFGVLDSMNYIQQQGQQGRAQGKENRLAQLSQQAYGASGQERQSALAQMEGTTPGTGLAMGGKLQANDDDKAQRYGGAARYLLNAIETKNPAAAQGAYAATRGAWEELAQGRPIPEQFDDTMLPMLHQIIAASEGAGGGAANSIHSGFIDREGRVMNRMRDGSTVWTGSYADPRTQLRDHPGMPPELVDLRGGTTSPLMTGQGAPQQQGQPQGGFQVIDVGNGEPPIDPRGVQAAAMSPGAEFADSSAGPVNTASGQPWHGNAAMPLPAAARPAMTPLQEASNRRAEEANMRADEAAQRAARGSAPAGQRFRPDGSLENIPGARVAGAIGNKPMPVGALKAVLEVEDALGGAETAFALSEKHLRRIASGELTIGPMQRATTGVKTFLGQAGPNDVNYNELIGDRTKLVNDSLRLNKGVQTEGDAQRAANEMMNSNDQATTVRAFKRLVEINKRGMELQRRKREMIEANYAGKTAQQAPDEDGIDALLDMYR